MLDPGDAQAGPYKVNSLVITPGVDPIAGSVRWDAGRTAWNIGMLLGALVLGPIYFTWGAFILFGIVGIAVSSNKT